MEGKLLIFSAPSGAGKTTIVKEILARFDNLSFSVSATSRQPRPGEENGRDYYFMDEQEFRALIANDSFVEWEEVYPGTYYGTLRSEIERIWSRGKHVVFDVDVKGGISLKRKFGTNALSVFIQPPSPEILAQRLRQRGTDNEASIQKRLDKAAYELTFAGMFDEVVVNNQLNVAIDAAARLVSQFLGKP